MFFSNKKKDLEKELSDLKQEIFVAKGNLKSKKSLLEEYEGRIKTLKADLESLTEELVSETEFVVNFASMKAFSIERIWDNKTRSYKTVIGYFLTTNNTKEVREWYLFCDLETHNRLADEFKQYMESLNK